MSKRPKPKRDDEEQSRLFIKKAHELGAEGVGELRGDELIRQLAKKPPYPRKKGTKRDD